jgi:hypothetical protein
MSDTITNTLPPPSVSTGRVGDLSQTQVDQARAGWIARGLDAAAFDAAVNGTPLPSQPAAPSPGGRTTTPALTPTGVEVNLDSGVHMTAQQAEQMAEQLARNGVDPARIRAALEADGFTVEPDAGADMTPEEAAAAEAQQERNREHGFDRVYDPSEYRISFADAIRSAGKPIHPDQLANINSAAQEYLSSLQLPPRLGGALVERAMQVGQQFNRMTDAQKSLHRQEVSARADAETLRLAHVALNAGDENEFKGMLATAMQNDRWILQTMANHGRVLESYWAGKRG